MVFWWKSITLVQFCFNKKQMASKLTQQNKIHDIIKILNYFKKPTTEIKSTYKKILSIEFVD